MGMECLKVSLGPQIGVARKGGLQVSKEKLGEDTGSQWLNHN